MTQYHFRRAEGGRPKGATGWFDTVAGYDLQPRIATPPLIISGKGGESNIT